MLGAFILNHRSHIFKSFRDTRITIEESGSRTEPERFLSSMGSSISSGGSSILGHVSLILGFLLFCYLPYRVITRMDNFTNYVDFTIPDNVTDLIPAEKRYQGKYPTLLTFRTNFCLPDALRDYQEDPIAYSVALSEVCSELVQIVRKREPYGLEDDEEFTHVERLRKDLTNPLEFGQLPKRIYAIYTIIYFDVIKPHLQLFWNWKANFSISDSSKPNTSVTPTCQISWTWRFELEKFQQNLRALCKKAGSEAEKWDPPLTIVDNLRKYSADRRDLVLSSVCREKHQLSQEVQSYKRINSALQTRHTIEQLVKLVPSTFKDDNQNDVKVGDTVTAKWRKLWPRIWKDAQSPESPFHELWKEEQGWASKHYLDRGLQLYGEMSEEIHRFQAVNKDDYQHFSPIVLDISRVLKPDLSSGEPNWTKERDKYKTDVNGKLEFVSVAEKDPVRARRRSEPARRTYG